jgi:hypothetical protein
MRYLGDATSTLKWHTMPNRLHCRDPHGEEGRIECLFDLQCRRLAKITCCAWAGRTFFPVVLLCQFFGFWWEILGFGVTYLRIYRSTIELWCCVSFLVLAENSFWCYVRTWCTIHLCSCVSFFVVAGNSVVVGNSSQNENTFCQKNLIGLLYYDPIAYVCILYDPTLLYSVSFYSVSFSCIAQIHKLKFKSEYYLRINMWNRVKIRTPAISPWFPEQLDFPNTDSKKNSTWVSLLKRYNLLANLCFL